ncbi:TVP38/TMEM64 family protein [Cohnella sp. LGH]|uniref:TVP38/TMEM64 family membrane protein n=1 Tax=Cohnella phaseoli TaxID=456490 RepID=A0A3D9KGP7_9BACL|nr:MULTISPECIES: TVP38/TMEM64 family protein [Cohnella]QTH41710.1 TVP38/TMEM64 family protein [Cohnella sp. LGH]RED85327.1 putative membrane protein YdjX (TVP38/TMEM64 family) [Cohnella phaseoli]
MFNGNFNLEEIELLLHRYSQFGPLPGIALPFLEALLPVLPLVVFIVANAAAYGMWWGFLYSWIGVTLGALLVFSLARRLGNRYGDRIRARFPKSKKFFEYIERKGFTPIFLLACFPFSPSVIVNIASGMSRIPFHTFLTAMGLGKAVMIFTLSFLGHDLQAMADQPWRIVFAVSFVFLMWLGGRKLESRYQ